MEDYKKIAIELGQTLISKAPETREDVERMLPELKESDDERIRKELIEFVKNRGGFKQEYIAWIEEQANYANFRNGIKVGDKVTKNEDGVLVNLSQLKRVAKKDENQGEQKPAWSEEDELRLNTICELLGGLDCQQNWLKSLKDRVQPKQDWSEEDDKKRKGLIKGLEDRMGFGWASDPFSREEYIDWLKSLRPQKQWKPTEEQLVSLKLFIERYPDYVYNKELDDLYNILKAL